METIAQGTLVAERYCLIREIGFGAMGAVWLAHDSALDSLCAIKLIGASQAKHEEALVRFECEAKCAAQLRGAHVVDVLNRGQWQGKPFIVMEYLEGEDLAERLGRLGRLDARATYRIVAQVARALMRAHALGIVHRDIKPENIFLVPGDDHEVAKVLDFGVAQHSGLPNAFDGPADGQFIGTPSYMSPEQASGRAVDARSDLWALAVIAFECLTGELPFQDGSVLNTIQSITSGAVPSLTKNRPELPAELEFWWQRASARDIRDRFQSAKELADALAEAIGVHPMQVSGFPAASALASTVLEPRSNPAPSRPALAIQAPRPRSVPLDPCETGAAVTIHSGQTSSVRFQREVRGRFRRASPYLLAGTALCAAIAFALAVSAWRPALDEVATQLRLKARPDASLLRTTAIGVGAEVIRAGPLNPTLGRQLSAAAVVPAELSKPTSPPIAAEPTVFIVPRAPALGTRVPAKKAPVVARKANHWQPLAPPLDKDYGI